MAKAFIKATMPNPLVNLLKGLNKESKLSSANSLPELVTLFEDLSSQYFSKKTRLFRTPKYL